MRLSLPLLASVLWTASVCGLRGRSEPTITFNDDDFQGLEGSSILNNPNGPKTFTFTSSSPLNVNSVNMIDATSGDSLAWSTSPQANVGLKVARQGETQWTITLSNIGVIFDEGDYAHTLYFAVDWATDSDQGSSYSRSFTFANNFAQVTGQSSFYITSPFTTSSALSLSVSTIASTLASTSAVTATPSSTGTETTSTSTSTSTPTDDAMGSSQTTSAATTSTGRTSSRPSSGAIAGIVIGVVAGLALLGGLAWFLWNRRRRRANGGGAYTASDLGAARAAEDDETAGLGQSPRRQATSSDGFISEKERSVGVATGLAERDAADSREQPYSDGFDSPTRPAAPVDNTTANPANTTNTANTASRSVVAADPAPTSQSPESSTPALSGHMAALIDDDMTPEEVARLAAEERELDAAIARARNNRSAGARE